MFQPVTVRLSQFINLSQRLAPLLTPPLGSPTLWSCMPACDLGAVEAVCRSKQVTTSPGIHRLRGCAAHQLFCRLLNTVLVCRERRTFRRVQRVQGLVLRGWLPANSSVQDLLRLRYDKANLLQGKLCLARIDGIDAVRDSVVVWARVLRLLSAHHMRGLLQPCQVSGSSVCGSLPTRFDMPAQ